MKTPKLIPMKKVDWIENQEDDIEDDHDGDKIYRIQSNVDVIEDRRGRLAIVLHQDGEYSADSILSRKAQLKLLYLIKRNQKGGRPS
jgi:hypothetical protein